VEVTRLLSKIIKAPYVHIKDKKVINVITPASKKSENLNLIQKESQQTLLAKAQKEAQIILGQAERERTEMLRQIQEEKEKILQKAFQEGYQEGQHIGKEQGYQEGYQVGYQEGEQEAVALKADAESILQAAYEEKDRILQGIEPKMVQLLENILEKMVGATLKFHPNVILFLIKKGFQETSFKGDIHIYVSEEDYDTVVKNKEEFLRDIEQEVIIMKESSLQRGDCILETPIGNIDCSLGSQFQEVKKELYMLFEQGEE